MGLVLFLAGAMVGATLMMVAIALMEATDEEARWKRPEARSFAGRIARLKTEKHTDRPDGD